MQYTGHRGQEQEEGLTNYTKSSDTIRLAGATPLTTPRFRWLQLVEVGNPLSLSLTMLKSW